MSTWNLGADDVSEETRAFRDKLSSKDGQLAAQQDRLVKQAADIDELKERLNESLHKLTSETQRALQLETDLQQRSEDLRDEKIASDNVKAALATALEKNKGSGMEMRDLEATLEKISHTSDEHKARSTKLEREKAMLEMRVRELETNLRAVSQPTPTTTPGRRAVTRPRSSSLSNFRITTLEQDISETRALLVKREAEVENITQKFSQAQKDLIKVDNEKVAAERKWGAQLEALQASLEEKEEELAYLRQQEGDGSREEELLKRIEEDDAKIAALELMVRGTEDSKQLEERVRRLEVRLKDEQRHQAEGEERYIELVREKEEALDELDDARQQFQLLAQQLQERATRDYELNEKAVRSLKACDDPLMNDDSCLIDMNTLEPQPLSRQITPTSQPTGTDADTLNHIERLLAAVDRLRGERDSLRRDVQFLESESKFAIEALEAKLAASMSTASDQHLATINQLKQEMDEMHPQMASAAERIEATLHAKNLEIRRLGVHVQGLVVTLCHVTPGNDFSAAVDEVQNDLIASQAAVEETRGNLKDLEEKYDVTVLCLEAITSQRDDLLGQLQDKDAQWETELEPLKAAEQDARQQLDELMHQLSELNAHLEDVESDRDSLTLQVTNLMTDLQNVQDELTNAESRYTNLQFHQLSNMTSNEATRTLRDHIEELEMRVMRRTEQIGIHQHDIKRLETNLRLQEERLGEMTTELEMMEAQKDAMVEDCADARETRNEALARVEALEEELEASSENEGLVSTLIAVVADTTTRAREAIRRAKEDAARARQDLSAVQGQQVSVQDQLEDKAVALATLTQQAEEHRQELRNVTTALAASRTEAEEMSILVQTLQQEKAELETQLTVLQEQDHDSTICDLQLQKKELENRLQEREQSSIVSEDTERELVQLKLQHAEALANVQGRLIEAESALEEVQTRYKSSEDDHQRALEEARSSIHELEEQLDAATNDLSEIRQLSDKSHILEKEHATLLKELQDELNKTSEEAQKAQASRDALQAENTRLVEELDRAQLEHDTLLAQSHDETLALQQELDKKVQSLQSRFEENARLLDISKEEAARLALRLQEQVEGRAHDQKKHSAELLSAKERSKLAEESLSQVEKDLTNVQDDLQRTQDDLKAAEEEKTTLQQETTTLEAEVQKSKSLSRYLEAQIKDSEHLVSALREDIERVQADLARSEKACKAAEVNLSLQNAQRKRETSELQRELSALRSRPNLEHALSELEERNNEMEELLRTKCAEIEENDDRVLEMLKEKKKLTTKVESLTRKVQNLQAKLAAAKASNTAQPFPEVQVTPPSSSAKQTPSQPISLSISRPRSATLASTPTAVPPPPTEIAPMSAARRPLSRVVSGPSSLPRPKTPERTRTIAPVFKARTPERRMAVEMDSVPSAVVIGKKRAAPDDFEACENLPAQAFSPEGEDIENRTPRVRRVLNSLQSGFTPVRNQHNRPTIPMPSPRRPRPAPLASDMTNSPHSLPPMPMSSSKPSKRSWLGKIRGSSHSVDRPSGMRSLFDRGESS